MTKPRVIETDQGIQGDFEVGAYDQMQRRFRDKGWMETKAIIKAGLTTGTVLEVGPGPGYLGLEWLKQTNATRLTGLDISPDMIALARRNAAEYGLEERVEYIESSGAGMPFPDGGFDGVFSNGSLHEWADVAQTLSEMWRVLRPGGRLFLSDLRRDMLPPIKWFMWLATRPTAIRPGLVTSVRASYTPAEAEDIMRGSHFPAFTVDANPMGIEVTATK